MPLAAVAGEAQERVAAEPTAAVELRAEGHALRLRRVALTLRGKICVALRNRRATLHVGGELATHLLERLPHELGLVGQELHLDAHE